MWMSNSRGTKITAKQRAVLHVAKKQMGLTDADYRNVLNLYGGVESSKDMTPEGFRNVLAYLQKIGFKLPKTSKVYQNQTKAPYSDPGALPTPAQLNRMQEYFLELEIDAADRQQAFCRRQIKKPWAQTRAEANKIIEGLKAMVARKEES